MNKQDQKYIDLMQELMLVERKLDNAYEELQQKEQHFEDYKKDINNNYIPKSKLDNMIKRLEIQTENEYCDFAIMVLNVILGG